MTYAGVAGSLGRFYWAGMIVENVMCDVICDSIAGFLRDLVHEHDKIGRQGFVNE